ncbi:hypothetical protein [Moraxella pluranimalium]|nr:hypothetical protein [Moraxella pluranimalium]
MNKFIVSWISCALLGMGSIAHAEYQFPKEIYQGYWAMTEPVFGDYGVINFRQSDSGIIASNHLRFECLADGKYRQVGLEMTVFEPKQDKMAMIDIKTKAPFAYLETMMIVPKEGLILKQTYADETMQELFPDGLLFAYVHTPTPTPLCLQYIW